MKNLIWILLAVVLIGCSSSNVTRKYDAESPKFPIPHQDVNYDGDKLKVTITVYSLDYILRYHIDHYTFGKKFLILYGKEDVILCRIKRENIESLKFKEL